MTAASNEDLLAQLSELHSILDSIRLIEHRITAVEQMRDDIGALRTKPNRATRVRLALEMVAVAKKLCPDAPILSISVLPIRRLH
jgi:hypothetical protein